MSYAIESRHKAKFGLPVNEGLNCRTLLKF